MTSSLTDLLQAACEKRRSLETRTNALRLVNAKGDGIPGIAVDRYGDHFVVYAYEEADSSTASQVASYIRAHYSPSYLVIKERSIRKTHVRDTVVIQESGSQTVVREGQAFFEVDLNDTANVGLFLDMRKNRWMVADAACGKSVLNLFSYTCAFGVACRKGKAERVVNVDVSKKALERGRRNYELNALMPHPYEFVKADSMRYLNGAQKKNNLFDIIVIDPPTFARSEKGVFALEKELPRLLHAACAIVKEEGKLFIATNASTITHDDLDALVHEVVRQAQRKLHAIIRCGQDSDFPGSGKMKESHLSAVWVTII